MNIVPAREIACGYRIRVKMREVPIPRRRPPVVLGFGPMNLLAAVLPSVRGLRAPLVAGALALIAAWILVEPHLSQPPTGLYKELVDLDGQLQLGATTAAVFLASVVGSILSTGAEVVVSAFSRSGWPRELKPLLSSRGDADTTKHLRDRLDALKSVPAKRRPFNPLGRTAKSNRMHLQREWRQLRFRLLENHREIFDEIDRLEAEAEFRTAIALPVVGLGVAASVAPGAGWWWWILGVIIAVALIAAAVSVSLRVERTMVDLVLDGIVTLPVLDAIHADAHRDGPVVL